MNVNLLKSQLATVLVVLSCAGAALAGTSLPAGYTQLEWIQSTGRQCIGTGVFGTGGTQVEVSFSHVANSPSSTIFGEVWAQGGFLLCTQDDCLEFWSTGIRLQPFSAYDPEAVYTFSYGNGSAVLKQGETVVTNSVAETVSTQTGKEVMIFGLSATERLAAYRLYRLKLTNVTVADSRDFVPCRNPAGEAGLYDLLNGRFYGNVGGEDSFIGSDQAPAAEAMLSWIQSDGNQYVVTDLQGLADTAVDFRFSHATYANKTTFFGEDKWIDQGFLFCMQKSDNTDNLQFWAQGANLLSKADYETQATIPHVFHLGNGKASLTPEGGSGTLMSVQNISNKTTDKRISVFGLSAVDSSVKTRCLGSFRFYGMKVWASEGGALQGDVRPYRSADGRIGLYNATTSTFYPNLGTANLSWGGIAYTWNGTTLCAQEGTLAAADVNGWDTVEKTSLGTLAAGAVTAYPGALTLTQGLFSLADGVVRRHEVAGALTLKGGARLAIDMTADGCDTFAAASVVLDETATSASPVTIDVNASIAALPDGASLEIFPGATFTDGDAERLVVSGFPARLQVVNGALVMTPRSAGFAEWTGAAQNGKWSAAHNWTDDTPPVSGASVLFDTAAGGETINDLVGGGRFASLTFGPGAGAFIHSGSTPLAVQAAITNSSAAAQTLAMPLVLGLVNETFLVDAASPLSLAGGVEMAGAAIWASTGSTARPARPTLCAPARPSTSTRSRTSMVMCSYWTAES